MTVVLDHRYYRGTFKDFSGYSNDGLLTSVYFRKAGNAQILTKDVAAGRVGVIDDVSTQITHGTIIVFGKFRNVQKTGAVDYMVTKGTGAGMSYYFTLQETGSTKYIIFTGSKLALDVRMASFLAVTFNTGFAPKFYMDGTYQGDGDIAATVTALPRSIYILNNHVASNNSQAEIFWTLIDNKILSAAEINDFWVRRKEILTAKKTFKKKPIYPSKMNISGSLGNGLLGAWSGELTANKQTAEDLSGNGHDGTIAYQVGQKRGPMGPAFGYVGSDPSIIDLGDVNEFENLAQATVCGWIRSALPLGSSFWFSKWVATGNSRWGLWDTSGVFYFSVGSGSATISSIWAMISGDKSWHFFMGTYDGSDVLLYVDNVAQTPQNQTGPMGGAGTGASVSFGNIAAYATGGDCRGDSQGLRIYNRVLTVAEMLLIYLEGAKTPLFIDSIDDTVSLASKSSGQLTENWLIKNGTWEVSDKISGVAGEKQIENSVAGIIYRKSIAVYGTWEFKLRKSALTPSDIVFISSIVATKSTVGQNGYYFRVDNFGRVEGGVTANGTPTILMQTGINSIAIDIWYTFRIVRTIDSQFYFYIKGGAYKCWTLVDGTGIGSNPFTNNLYKSSSYFVCDLNANDYFRDFKILTGAVFP